MDPIIFSLLIASILLSLYAQITVSGNFKKYSRVSSRKGFTGAEVARLMLDRRGIYDVDVVPVRGNLTDHYDPTKKVVRLSESVYDSSSISAISVAAHEVGHAIQDNEGYSFLRFRSALAPAVSFTSGFVWNLILLGLLFQSMKLINIGIIFFTFTVLFQIVTLPVEINASRRALANLETDSIIYHEEAYGSRKVLKAAALTYVAAMLYSIVNLLRLLSMRNRND